LFLSNSAYPCNFFKGAPYYEFSCNMNFAVFVVSATNIAIGPKLENRVIGTERNGRPKSPLPGRWRGDTRYATRSIHPLC
jgi:hypothetical protein